MTPAPPSRDLSFEEVAARLGVSLRTVVTLVKSGNGPPSYKLSTRRLFPADQFEQWLAEQRVGAR